MQPAAAGAGRAATTDTLACRCACDPGGGRAGAGRRCGGGRASPARRGGCVGASASGASSVAQAPGPLPAPVVTLKGFQMLLASTPHCSCGRPLRFESPTDPKNVYARVGYQAAGPDSSRAQRRTAQTRAPGRAASGRKVWQGTFPPACGGRNGALGKCGRDYIFRVHAFCDQQPVKRPAPSSGPTARFISGSGFSLRNITPRSPRFAAKACQSAASPPPPAVAAGRTRYWTHQCARLERLAVGVAGAPPPRDARWPVASGEPLGPAAPALPRRNALV